jgi:DNA-binding MarR family transcriptional regulator
MPRKVIENRLTGLMRDTVVGLVRRDGADLTARQMSVVLIVYLEGGDHTIRGLARRLNIAKPPVTRAIDRLEQFDLVRREPDPGDGRSVLVTRTAPGTAYVAYIRSLLQAAAKVHGVELKALAPSA